MKSTARQRTYAKPVEAKVPSVHKPPKAAGKQDAARDVEIPVAEDNLLVQAMHRQGLFQAKLAITSRQVQHSIGNQAVQRALRSGRQNHATDSTNRTAQLHETAQRGLSGNSQPLPHLGAIQRSFGQHAVSRTRAFVGGAAKAANEQMGSAAFAVGDSVAFSQAPDLHTAAHEAAHTVQQRAGVQLPGGVGKSGDRHERHADDVADAVVRGESAEPLLDRYGTRRWSGSVQVQHQDGSGSTTTAEEEVCEALRSQFASSHRVIALYREFLAGNVDWESTRAQLTVLGNAWEGVTGAGHDLPQVVQDAIEEVESFGLEEIQQMGAMLWETLFGDTESRRRQLARIEIERQQHFNLVLIESMYENACPDFPGTWRDYQEQVLSIGTRGQVPGTTPVRPPRETRTALAWVEIDGEEVLVLATEVSGSGRLRFVRWIESEFRDLALQKAGARQGSIPSVPGNAVSGLPSGVPSSATRR